MYYIYRITNKVNGKTYIGQHKYKKLNDRYMGSGILLAKAKNKYGIKNFEKEILYSRIQYKETVDDIERFAIAKERANGKAEYNIADGGYGGCGRISEEHKRKISEANRGRIPWNKGKHWPNETKMKISKKMKGRSAPNKGVHHSEETKRKLSEANKGRHLSEETRHKISEALKRRTHWSKCCPGPNKGKHWKLVDGKRTYY